MKSVDFLNKYSWIILNDPWTLSSNNIRYARIKLDQGGDLTGVLWEMIFHQNLREYYELQLFFGLVDLEEGHLDCANDHLYRARNSCCCSNEEERWLDLVLALVAWYRVLKNAPRLQWDRGKKMLEEMFTFSIDFVEERRKDFKIIQVCEPENVYPWLFDCKRKSHLSSTAAAIYANINSAIKAVVQGGKVNPANVRSIEKMITQLNKIVEVSQDAMEVGEGLVGCGMAYYQLNEDTTAVRYFEQAILKYPPETHCQAIARWLLGAVYWKISGSENNAQIQWQAAIESFEDAALEAQYKNDKDLVAWYRDAVDVMEKARSFMATKCL